MSEPSTIEIPPTKLHQVWPFVLPGLQAIIRKTKPSWIAEDIYSALRTGAALLLISLSAEKPIGFTITYFNEIPFSGQKEYFVWCAWTIPPAQRTAEDDVGSAVRHTFARIEAIARQGGATKVTCLSPRPGFGKWAAQFGFKSQHTSYAKDL